MARVAVAAIGFAIAGIALAACNLTTAENAPNAEPKAVPDAIDVVRNTDLEPRFPSAPGTADTGTRTAQRPSVFYGSGGAAPRAAEGAEPTADGGGYELNFENTPIPTVTKVILGDILGVGYTIDPRIQGTITLSSGRPISKRDVLFALESALRTVNAVLVRDNSGYRLIPASDAVGSGSVDVAGDGKSTEPGYGITIVPLQYVSVQAVTKLLDSFAMKPGAIRADPSRNLLVIQGSGAERRAAAQTVLDFDADWMRGQSVGIYPVTNSTPEPLITELEKIMDSGEGGLSQNMVKLQAIDRLNAILVVSRKPELLRTVALWIKRLDSSETASTGVKVYRVRFGDARQIARILNQLFVGGSQGSLDSAQNQIAPGGGTTALSSVEKLSGGPSAPTTSGQRPAAAPLAPSDTGPGGGAGRGASLGAGTAGGGTSVLPDVRITPDVANNSLLIYANSENYRIIERALNQIDRPQLQVALEATIAEVTLNDNLNYGVQFFLQNSLQSGATNPDITQVINTAAQSLAIGPSLPGFNFLLGPQTNPRVVLNALHAYTDVKVLSDPSLVVINNQSASLEVGDQVPVTTGTATVLSTSNTVVNTIDYKNTGIILHVTPRINANGTVLLGIEQEISSVDTAANTGTLTPTLSQRKVKSQISVVSGQTVLLAGLISETQSRSRSGLPFLDQIPGIGEALSQNQKQLQRTELIIFIRPEIIRDSVDASVVAEELRSKIRGSKVGTVHPPGAVPPIGPHTLQ
jgi:general secretion pathway protein D